MTEFEPRQLVWWKLAHNGGRIQLIPAEVLGMSVSGKRVEITATLEDGSRHLTWVRPENLEPRSNISSALPTDK